MSVPTMQGITPQTITTDRLTTRVLTYGPEDGEAVLFLHGNTSSATWWEGTLAALPPGYRGLAPDQRGFGEADPEAKIDATRGMGDLADDAAALLAHLGIERAHIVGNSLGGMVVWRLMSDHPEIFLSATLADPGSPYGFGATRDLDGTPTNEDFAGSGGGLANPELIRRLKANDMTTESQFSPRAALRALLVKPPFIPPREDELVAAMNSTHIGERDVPGELGPIAALAAHGPGKMGRQQRNLAQIPDRRGGADQQRTQDAGTVGAREPRPGGLRHGGLRSRLPGQTGPAAGLAGRGRVPAPADGGPDARRAGKVRRGRGQLH